jgi:hypothetical protein
MAESRVSRLQWAELITTLGVLVSLVFVGFEIRQNTAVARGQARTDLATLNQDWLMAMAADSALQRYFNVHWLEDDGELSRVQVVQAQNAMIAMVRRLENAFLFFREGLIPEGALRSYGMRGPWFERSRFRNEFWPYFKDTFDPEFVAFAESEWRM